MVIPGVIEWPSWFAGELGAIELLDELFEDKSDLLWLWWWWCPPCRSCIWLLLLLFPVSASLLWLRRNAPLWLLLVLREWVLWPWSPLNPDEPLVMPVEWCCWWWWWTIVFVSEVIWLWCKRWFAAAPGRPFMSGVSNNNMNNNVYLL